MLWIIHSCLPLSFCVVYTLVLDTLDYSFLIAPVVLCLVHHVTWYSGLFILDCPCHSVLYSLLLDSLDYSFLLPLSFCLIYSLLLDTQDYSFLIAPVVLVLVLNITWYSGLFILDCPCCSGSYTQCYLILWIIHSWLSLRFSLTYFGYQLSVISYIQLNNLLSDNLIYVTTMLISEDIF